METPGQISPEIDNLSFNRLEVGVVERYTAPQIGNQIAIRL